MEAINVIFRFNQIQALRVIRGGAWHDASDDTHVDSGEGDPFHDYAHDLGFRVVKEL